MRVSLLVIIGVLFASGLQAQQKPTPDMPLAERESLVQGVYRPQRSARSREAVYQVANNSASPEFYFSDHITDIPRNESRAVFDCVGAIYAVLKFPASDRRLRNMQMHTEWVNPQGEVELLDERAQYAEQNGIAYRWGGIILRRPQGGGLFSLLDHSAGMERFIGEWQVNLILDGLRLPAQSMRVEC